MRKFWGGLAGLSVLLPALVSGAVTTPEAYFHHKIGADREIPRWEQVLEYFRQLPKQSNRIQVMEYGRSAENRPLIAAIVASPETLRNLDRYREIQRRLADPRLTTPAEAEPLFRQGKSVVLITCSIHASEIASTQTAVEFAWRLVSQNTPRIDRILKNTIIILVPSLNPDGVDIVGDWYRKTLNTKWEGTSPPELYHKYVGHDNNRDWYILSQPETRATVARLHNVWHPEIVYDVHQQGAGASRIFIPPWLDPIEPNVDPILVQEMNMMGMSMASDLTAAGRKGVAVHALYDFWTPSRHYQSFHGGMRILSESASVRLATPLTLAPEDIDETALGYNPRERSWNYPEPWLGGSWHLRDIIDDQEIAFESLAYNAAIHREETLRNFYKVGQHQVARMSPWGAVIPKEQRDPGAARKMMETLAAGAVEISQDAAGNYVIPFQQPYSGYARALLEKQKYPNDLLYPGGPPKRPYDVTAHTLPLLFGVETHFVDKPVIGLKNAVLPKPEPAVTYSMDWWKSSAVKRPRLGLYKSWMANMDEGWTRWLLEDFNFPYTSLHNADLQAGNLHAKFDAIVFADEQPAAIANGHPAGTMPPEYTGGLGEKGLQALKQFVAAGGTLVFLNRASGYATEHLGIKAVPAKDYYSPGSLLNATLDTRSPLAKGLPERLAIWAESSPVWDTLEPSPMKLDSSNVLASGWLLGENKIAGRSVLIDSKQGNGHIVLFGMRPQYRAQSYQTFKLFFNAIGAR